MFVGKGKQRENTPIHYQVYIMNIKEIGSALIKGCIFIGLVSYLFYSSAISFVCMLPYLYLYLRKEKKRLCRHRLEQLRREFKDGIQALQAALDTGYSVENAFSESCKDLAMLYPDGSYITTEFRRIVHGIRMNKTVEEMLMDFARRSGLEEVNNFAEVFTIAKKSGGDLIMIIRSTAQTIGDKIDVENEIETMMTGKILEQKVMNVIPFGILAYVRLTSGDFLDIMYKNPLGIGIMSICLAVYLAAVKLADRIVDVEV